LGKGLGGGIIPFAAMVCRDEYNVAQDISLGYFTYEKSPLGCAEGQAVIDFIEKEKILEKVARDALWMEEQLHILKSKYPIILDIRGMGLLWAVDLADSSTGEPAANEAEKVMYSFLEHGLSFKVSQGHVLQLSPALTIIKEELIQVLGILEKAIRSVS
jgi:4-aminobutyrate aminotransferase